MKCAEDKMQRLLGSFARSGYSNIQNQRRNAMPPIVCYPTESFRVLQCKNVTNSSHVGISGRGL